MEGKPQRPSTKEKSVLSKASKPVKNQPEFPGSKLVHHLLNKVAHTKPNDMQILKYYKAGRGQVKEKAKTIARKIKSSCKDYKNGRR